MTEKVIGIIADMLSSRIITVDDHQRQNRVTLPNMHIGTSEELSRAIINGCKTLSYKDRIAIMKEILPPGYKCIIW